MSSHPLPSTPSTVSSIPLEKKRRLNPIWQARLNRFRHNRLGVISLFVFALIFVICMAANVIANDKPLLVQYQSDYYFPVLKAYPETTFGGVFETETNYKDPAVQTLINDQGYYVMPLIPFADQTPNVELGIPYPAAPNSQNWLGTDDLGRDVLARILYGMRVSLLFGLALTLAGALIGIIVGAIQGYYGGWVDLAGQRFMEVWGGMPQLFMIIILVSLFSPSITMLFAMMLLFGWMGLVGLVRAEFLRARNFDYVRAARNLGVSDSQIMLRHILPNALASSLSQLPFILTANIIALTALDFLGYGLPPGSPSLGELMVQGKNNLDAPWLALSGFFSLTFILSLLIFVGEALRDAFDPSAPDMTTDKMINANMITATEQNNRLNDSHSKAHSKAQNKLMLIVDELSIATNAGTALVDKLTYELRQGQTLAIVGESGSGKSIASLALLGLLPDSLTVTGEVQLADATGMTALSIANVSVSASNNNKARNAALRAVRGQRIGMVFQEPMTALNPLHTVAKQIAESLHLSGVPKKHWRERSIALLDDVNISDPADKLNRYPHELSGGQRQRVMIAMALAQQPDILIADEPTTALDVTLQHEILALLNDLKREHKMAMILISHDLNLVRRYSDEVIVMRQGHTIEQGQTAAVFSQPKAQYTRSLIKQDFGQALNLFENESQQPTVLQVSNLQVQFPVEKSLFGGTKRWFDAVNNVDMTLHKGQALGIIGESGSGKTTIALALSQLLSNQARVSGQIMVNGQDISALSKRELRTFRSQIQMVFQDPFASINPRMTVMQIVEEGLLVQGVDKISRQQAVMDSLATVHLPLAFAQRYPHELSGGQRQRVALARALIMQPSLLILDEPTSALDSTTQVTVVSLLREIQEKMQISYVFISHDLKVVRALCQHIMVLKEGACIEYGRTEEVFNNPEHPYAQQLLQASVL